MKSEKQNHFYLNLVGWVFILLITASLSSCSDDEVEPIVIEASDFAATIAENPTVGQVLGTITASTNRGTLSFAMGTSSAFNGAFAVNASSGQLSVADPAFFDFETNPTVTGSVVITNGPESKTVTITITLTDVVEVTVSANNFTLTIPENPAASAVLGTVTATTNVGSITYALTAQTPAGAMAINAATGQLTVNDRKKFNYELYPTITGTFTATNSGVTATGTITITLTDVAETVQQRLDDGETPKQIYDSDNTLLPQIYGKNYGGGFIAMFNPTTGTGLILSEEISGGPYNYSTAQTKANTYTGGGFNNWRIPEESDLGVINMIFLSGDINLLPFVDQVWGKGTCCSGGGGYSYAIGSSGAFAAYVPTSTLLPVRAIRQF